MLYRSSRSLDIDLLRTFHLACALGTLQAVATRRHFTLGAVSQQIKRLEQQLDRPLFIRSKRGVRLTAQGAQLRAQSAALIGEHDALLDRLLGQTTRGVVRLGLPEVYVPRLLDTLLPALRQTYPNLALHVRTANSGELRRAIDRGELELAVVVDRAQDIPATAIPLWETRPVWAGSAEHDPAQDKTLPLALHPEDCPYRALGLAALASARRSWETVFASASVAAIESAVASGLAVSVLDRARLTAGIREISAAQGLPLLPRCFAYLFETPRVSTSEAEAVRVVKDKLQGITFNVSQRSSIGSA